MVILNEGLIKAMDEVGRLFEAGEFFIPEMLIAARAMKDEVFKWTFWKSSKRYSWVKV